MKSIKKALAIFLLAGICSFVLFFAACSCSRTSGKRGGTPHEHVYTVAEVVEHTCTEQGYTLYACACGDSYKADFTAAGHRFVTYSSNSLCGAQGSYVFRYCTACDRLETSESVLHPHDYVLEKPSNPTCTSYGVEAAFICENCGHREVKKRIAPLGHRLSGAFISAGTRGHYKICARGGCGKQVYFSHRWDEKTLKVTKAATCTENGALQKTCADCGYAGTVTIPAHCIFGDYETVSRPTCTEPGKERRTCSRCGKERFLAVKALGHNWGNYVELSVPDCTHTGLAQYTCLRCGATKTQILDYRHDYGDWVVTKEATCTQNGERERSCTLCGYTQTEPIVARHVWDGGVEVTEPGCTEAGETLYTCTRCGETEIREEPAALGHARKTIEKEATCTEGGYKMVVCTRCGEILEVLHTTPPLGHLLNDYTYDDEEHWKECERYGCDYATEKEAHTLQLDVKTERKDGEYLHIFGYMCKCGYVSDEKSVLHEHEKTELIEQTATCLKEGNSYGLKCGVAGCNEILVTPQPIPALGHNFVDGKCLRCGAIDYDALQTPGLEYELERYDTGDYYVVAGIGTATATDIVIARTHNGLPVREIKYEAFKACTSLTSVTVSDSVRGIGSEAFASCSSLKKVLLPKNLEGIGSSAFADCVSLKEITIPGVDLEWGGVIGSSAFAGCTMLESVTIENGMREIRECAFWGCTALTRVTLPEGLELIMDRAFEACKKLAHITIPSSVTCIGDGAFMDCTALLNITIPDNAEMDIYTEVFSGCTSLVSVKLGSGVTNIRERLFAGCTSLKSITMGDGVETIEAGAFSGCEKLTNITIPRHVTEIKGSTFYGCASLGNITIPFGITSIGDYAFSECTSLMAIAIPDSVKDMGAGVFENCTSLKSVQIGKGITFIGHEQFAGCTSLTNLTIPDSIKEVGSEAFIRCGDCHFSVYITDIKAWCNIETNGPIFWLTTFDLYLNGELVTNIKLSDDVTSIPCSVFAYCLSLTEIEISSNLTCIDGGAFFWCANLQQIRYAGTAAQWRAIQKGKDWKYNTGDFTVVCGDGTVISKTDA